MTRFDFFPGRGFESVIATRKGSLKSLDLEVFLHSAPPVISWPSSTAGDLVSPWRETALGFGARTRWCDNNDSGNQSGSVRIYRSPFIHKYKQCHALL